MGRKLDYLIVMIRAMYTVIVVAHLRVLCAAILRAVIDPHVVCVVVAIGWIVWTV